MSSGAAALNTVETNSGEFRRDYSTIPEPQAIIRTEGLMAWFGETAALKGIDISIAEGKVTAIIGPSGCGKSTFIRSVNRMHEAVPGASVAGKVYYRGQDVYHHRINPVMLRRKIGMVFQKPNPFPMMSVRQNVIAGHPLQGKGSADADEIVERSLRQAALWDEVKDVLGKPGSSLSGGQQQRLCIARALAIEPEILLMDEPCSALDPIATAKIEDLIHTLKGGITIIIVTHNMQQASRVSDNTAFFYMGELIEYCDTDTMFKSPHNQRTEDYITGRFG
jgi:phosphate transport system ATP-binding protein